MIDQLANRYCKFLNVSVPFSEGALRSAYLIAVKKYHPDTNHNSNATSLLQEANAGYDYLKANALRINKEASSAPPPRPGNIYANGFSPTADPYAQFNKDADAKREPRYAPSGLILYRGPYQEIPESVGIPSDFFEPGCTIFMMIGGKEVRMNVPAGAKENFEAQLTLRGKSYTIKLLALTPQNYRRNPHAI